LLIIYSNNILLDATTATLAKLEPVPEKPLPAASSLPLNSLQRFKTDNIAHKTKWWAHKNINQYTITSKTTDITERHHQLFKAMISVTCGQL